MAGTAFATVLEHCTLVTVEGQLTSHALELPVLEKHPLELQIDLNGLILINSIGVRQFQNWITRIECEKVKLLFCPPIFVHQLNLVHEFLPRRCKVESFFVPYYSERTQEEQMVLFRRNIEFEKIGDKVEINKPIFLDSSGVQMELDIQSDRYFKFLEEYY